MKVTLLQSIKFHGIRNAMDRTLADGTLRLESQISISALPLVGQRISFAKLGGTALMLAGNVRGVCWAPTARRINVLEARVIMEEWDYREVQGNGVSETLGEVRSRLLAELSAQPPKKELLFGEIRFTECKS